MDKIMRRIIRKRFLENPKKDIGLPKVLLTIFLWISEEKSREIAQVVITRLLKIYRTQYGLATNSGEQRTPSEVFRA